VVGDGRGQHRAGGLVDPRLQPARERQVERGALARQQVVLDDLAQQRVAEPVAVVVAGDQDVALDRLAQPIAQRLPLEPAGRGQQGIVGPLGDGHEPQQLLRRLGQPLHAQHQRVAQRVRRRAAPVEAGGEELLAVQRVAARTAPEPLQQLGFRGRAENVRQLVGQLGVRERRECDPSCPRVALELGQQRSQWMPAVHLVGPVGADDQHALGLQAAPEERQRRARRAIRPVQVLDQQQHGLAGAEPVEQRQQALEQPALRAALAIGLGRLLGRDREPREQRGDRRAHGLRERRVARARERAQRGDERDVGQLALAEVDAVAGQHERTGLNGSLLDLGEQARLADARVAGHERQRRPPVGGVDQRGLELRQLGGAADQARARDPGAHLGEVRRCRARARRS
jgi:hypothetical protein